MFSKIPPFSQNDGNSIYTFQLFHFDTVTLLFCLCICPFFFATHPTFFQFPIAVLTLNLPLIEQNQGEIVHESFKIFSVHFLM